MKKLIAFLAAAFAVAAFGQEQPLPTFREAVEVRVMDLDVVVTDSRGRPVADLTQGEFSVKVDGKTVPIDYFTRVEEGTIHAPDLASASPDRVLAEYRKGEEAYVPRHFLVYVDTGHLSPGYRNRALEALRDFVTRLGPGDTGRIVLFDRRTKDLTPWTASKETMLSALSGMESGVGMSRLMTEQQTLRELDSTRSLQSRLTTARNYAQQELTEVSQMLKDMSAELTTLTALPGKKVFLFVSGGFETQPGFAMTQYAAGRFNTPLQAFDTRTLAPELDALTRRANASDVTFYAVDARGLVAEGVTASNDDPLANRPGVAFTARTDSQAGMLLLARDTGGLALINTNDFDKGLSRIYQDTSTYYSIGVNLSKLPATGYRDVQVQVSRPGLTVRARRGFAGRSGEERARDVTIAALRTNVEYRAIPVTLRLAPARKEKKYYSQPISVTVPASSLTLIPQGDASQARADIYIGVIDDSGNVSDVGREETTFNVPKNAPADAPLNTIVTLKTRKGNQRIVVNVQDKTTGRMGTAKADVRVE
ncbi:MAG TPA: VWA domain-containing protein [Thermoanaerobaculia bacterium]|nr:VWA domain-containing protein [Thermoanaerobaculia bacterium]